VIILKSFRTLLLGPLLLLTSCLFLLPFGSQVNAANKTDKVVLQLAWKHQFQFAGYYAALAQGYYREAGLDVNIIEGGEGRFAREELLRGRTQYGVAGSEVIV
jgi:ABC-type nitrate/sulfonate/bicarbonate transport system substrate-binding protein